MQDWQEQILEREGFNKQEQLKTNDMKTYTITLTWDELMTLKSSFNKALQMTKDGVECEEILNLKDKVTKIQWK